MIKALAVERGNERVENRVNVIKLNAKTLSDTPLNCLFLYLDKHPQDWDTAEILFKKCLITEEFRAFLNVAVLSNGGVFMKEQVMEGLTQGEVRDVF